LSTGMCALACWLVAVYAMATIVLTAALIALGGLRQPARRLAISRWTLLVLFCLPPLALLTKSTNGPSAAPDLDLDDVCYCSVSGATGGGTISTLTTIFVTCSGLVVAWLTLGALATTRVVMRSTDAPDALRSLLRRVVTDGSTPPRLRVGGVSQPVALGLFRPTIVLPGWFVETEPEAGVEAALAHEWTHLRRGDLWTLAASRVLLVVLFAHPLFYLFRGRLRADQEVLADAEAAGPRGNVAYAEALVGWARRTSRGSLGSSLGLVGRSSLLRKRVALLLDAEFRVDPTCPRGWTFAVRASAASAVTGLALLASSGTARSTFSALAPIVPHTHGLATTGLNCPSESSVPRWSGACMLSNVDVRCAEPAK
jgi:beta-lactamase regulating signal transducer with metallopeptidase domain